MKYLDIEDEENYLHIMTRDPSWLFVYWDIDDSFAKEEEIKHGVDPVGNQWVLRLFSLKNATNHDIAIDLNSKNWYVPVEPGNEYESSIGFVDKSGEFIEVVRGDKAVTSSIGISRIVDPKWKMPEEIFYSLISPYKFKSVFSMSSLIYSDSEWANVNWPLFQSVSSTDSPKSPRIIA